MRHQFQCLACEGVYFDTDTHRVAYAHVCGPLPADKKNPERERPDKRDENTLVQGRGLIVGIKSEGAGVKCLTDGKLREPRWISIIKAEHAKQEEKENA